MNRKLSLLASALAVTLTALLIREIARKRSGNSLDAPSKAALEQLSGSIRSVREATAAAFSLQASEDEYARLDSTARAEFSKLQAAFAQASSVMQPGLREVCERFVELASDAQIQLMAFAINRKNRGTPDSAQEEAELLDLAKFRSGLGLLSEPLALAFDAVGVAL